MSDDQFRQLTRQLNARFDKQDAVILKLYQSMEQRFAQIEATMATREELHSVYNLLDEHIKQRETNEQERLAIKGQLGRHERWIAQLADGTKVKIKPEPYLGESPGSFADVNQRP